MKIEIKELRSERQTYGGDKRAINRHSERTYKSSRGNKYILSKTLDGSPPFYEVYYDESHVPLGYMMSKIMRHIRINGESYWGNGLTWKQAEEIFFAEIKKMEEEELEPIEIPYKENRPAFMGSNPCLICGKQMSYESNWVILLDATLDVIIDPCSDRPNGGYHPIGKTCLKNNPQLRPYIVKPIIMK